MGAKWALCSASWRVGHVDEGLNGLLALENEYEEMLAANTLDIPKELLPISLGLIYEDLALIHQYKMKEYAQRAKENLSKDLWFQRLGKNVLKL